MNYPDIIAVGHICTDKIYVVDGFPQENTSKRIQTYHEQPGGSASQAMVTVSRLGGKAGYISPIGDDEAGRELIKGAVSEGIDMSLCPIVENGLTHFTNVMVNSKTQSRTFFSYHACFEDMVFDDEMISAITHTKILHLDNTQSVNALKAAKIAKNAGVLVSLDGSSLGPEHELNIAVAKQADILITAEKYPYALTGQNDLKESLRLLDRIFNPKILITTLGERGSVLYDKGDLIHFPAYQIQALDTTGAGDAFHGAFLYRFLKNDSLKESIEFATAVAALCCLRIGGRAGIPENEDEVYAFMKKAELYPPLDF